MEQPKDEAVTSIVTEPVDHIFANDLIYLGGYSLEHSQSEARSKKDVYGVTSKVLRNAPTPQKKENGKQEV